MLAYLCVVAVDDKYRQGDAQVSLHVLSHNGQIHFSLVDVKVGFQLLRKEGKVAENP